MRVAILCTGTELVRGELADTNGSWLAEAMTVQGHDVAEIVCIGDDSALLKATLSRLADRAEVILVCGGLGPTTDDLTRSVVADLLDVSLVRDPAQLEAIRDRLRSFGRSLTESNAKQAALPEGALVLANSEGTAPGFSVTIGEATAYFMPGVPHEMRVMFTAQVAPRIVPPADYASTQIVLRTYGMGESMVCDLLDGVERAHGVVIGYRAHLPDLQVKISARAATKEEALGRARSAADEVTRRLGTDVVFGEEKAELPGVVCELLVARKLSLALAESCTGGLVASLVTEHPGASRLLLGGVVAYSNEAKQNLLGVSREAIERWGAVSEPVAREMAEGARKVFGADVGLSITGVAGPTGATPDKPVGFVVFSVATAHGTTVTQARFAGTRVEVQRRAAFAGLALVRRIVRSDLKAESEHWVKTHGG